MGEMKIAYKSLDGKPDWKRPLRRPRHSWEDNIKMNLWEIGFGGVNWIPYGSAQGLVADSCEHSDEPSAFIEGEGFLD
jgi:hypothetical protein